TEPVLLVLSGPTETALRSLAMAAAARGLDAEVHLADLALASRIGRAHHEHRVALIGSDRAQLASKLLAFGANGKPGTLLTVGEAPDAMATRAQSYLEGHDLGRLASDRSRGARLHPLPPQPFEGDEYKLEFRTPSAGNSAPAAAIAPAAGGDVRSTVLSALAQVHGAPPERYQPSDRLGDDLGFDSLMTVDLERALRQRLPSLREGEALFDEGTTVDQLTGFVTAHLDSAPGAATTTPHSHRPPVPMKSTDLERQSWDHYADLIGGDPQETYVGGMYRFERHELRDLTCDGDDLTAVLDVDNKYAGTGQFHLTQMAAYAFVAQMVHGSLCYIHDVGKDDLGMPKLVRIDMNWHRLIRNSRDVSGKIKHVARRVIEDGRHELTVQFDVGGGGMTGELVGLIPIEAPIVPLEERAPQSFATLTDLYRKDPKDTYTGGMFEREIQTIRDVVVEGREIRAFVDVDNAFSGTPAFHLTQMGSYSCTVQLLIGYLCARYGVDRSKLGMPVLHHYGIHWREMVPFDRNIEFVLREVSCEDDKGRDKMAFEFTVGGDHGKGLISGCSLGRARDQAR
ncbi:MAG: phosphopantetheine-binding protein, partial [Planctomycetota bacterium]